MRFLPLLALLFSATLSVAAQPDCPQGCLTNAGPPSLGANGFLLPARCACDWSSNGMDANINLLNSAAFTPQGSTTAIMPAANTGTDVTTALQAVIDSGAPVVTFGPGTYAVCNLMPRALNQKWVGAGVGQTIITAFGACNNLVTTSFGGVFGGPTANWDVSGITFQGGVQAQLAVQCRDFAGHVKIHHNAFDTGGAGCPAAASGPSGISMTGCRDFVIEDNEFYSSCPGSGGRGFLGSGIRGGTIDHNISNWQETFIEIGSTVNQPTEFTNVSDNVFHGTFWGIPTKFTNSGATVSYAGSVLTDSAASFSGLCGGADVPPQSCAAAAGNFVRVMTAVTTGTAATFNTAGGFLTDASKNFNALGVKRGDIIRTTPVCLGNGARGQTARFSCPNAAGTASWGDSCVCTSNTDCASNTCEPRFATVDQIGTNTTLQVDEWVRDATCPLGATACPTSSRRPTGAVLSTSGIAYTLYHWAACQITSYTATTATCNTDAWIDWGGTVSTPANTTLYEVMYPRPLYFLLAGNSGSTNSTQNVRAINNTAVGGFADHFEMFGSQSQLIGNISRDCADTCYVLSGNKNIVDGNIADHCGARGIYVGATDSTITNNVASDSPWVRASNTTVLGDININGSRNTVVGNKAIATTPTSLARYGYTIFGNATLSSDGTIMDANTCQGSYSVACYRLDATGGTSTNTHLQGYHGESISNNGGTFSIEGGLCTQAQLPAAAQTGSTVGCSDCTAATTPCTTGGVAGATAVKDSTPRWACR